MDERSQGFGQPSFRAEQFQQQYRGPYEGQSLGNQAWQFGQQGYGGFGPQQSYAGQSFTNQSAQFGQQGWSGQAPQQYGPAGHQQYGATAQSYNPQQQYTSQWQRQPEASGYQGHQFSNQFSNQAQPYGQDAWRSQAGQQFGPSQHEQYGATAHSYQPQQNYSSQWQSYGQQAGAQSFANQGAYGQQGMTSQAARDFGQAGREQYGATAQSYQPQQNYSSQWQPHGQQSGAQGFTNRAEPFGQQAYGGGSPGNQAAQFGQQQAYGGQAFASQGQFGQYGQPGLGNQATPQFTQQFGQGGHQQYGANAQSYSPQQDYSSRWQSEMANEQGGAFRS